MLRTPFTDLVGCTVPVQAAPITFRAEFLAAVAAAGALPMMGTGTEPPTPEELVDRVQVVRSLTDAPLGVNFLAPFVELDRVAAIAPLVRVVEFFYADPDPAAVAIVHEAGALAAWQVGSFDEFVAAVDAGCDLVVAQGVEAGGHVRGTTPLLTLLAEVVNAAAVPVVAAGTIASGADMAAALHAGAGGVRIGTHLVASTESLAHPGYKQALVAASADDTVVTTTFGRDWPDAPHRVLRSAVQAAEATDREVVAEAVVGDTRVPIPRLSTAPPSIHAVGAIEAMALYAGESVDGIDGVRSVADIIGGLCAEAERLLDLGGA